MPAPTAQQLLDAIHAELLARVTGASIPEYTMPDGRSIRKIESSELRQLLADVRPQAAHESMATLGPARAYATFRRPS